MAGKAEIPVLRNCRLFDEVSDVSLHEIEKRLAIKDVKKGQNILERDESDRDVHYIVEGDFRATSFSENGRETIFRQLSNGEYFGEFAAIDGGPRTAAIVALTNGRLLHQSHSSFEAMLAKHPSISLGLLRQLTSRVRYLANRVYELSTHSVEARLHAELLRMANYRDGIMERVIDPFPRHVDVAGVIGTQREAVTRFISALVEKQVIRRDGKRIEILNGDYIITHADAGAL